MIQAIVRAVSIPCELGGGIRDEATIEAWLEIGLQQLVVGTRALQDADWFRRMAKRFPHRLVLGIDARQGRVATDGWLKTSDVSATELARTFQAEPLASIVYTDISKDGMLAGPNLEAMAEMKAAVACPVIASGGVTSVDDVVRLAEVGLDGCIIGRALYEGRLTLPAALDGGPGSSCRNRRRIGEQLMWDGSLCERPPADDRLRPKCPGSCRYVQRNQPITHKDIGMAKATVANIRNIAFCGHGSAGKTTLVDKILVKTGAASGHPSVDDGTSICDFDAEEKHHKYTIEASLVHFEHAGKRFNDRHARLSGLHRPDDRGPARRRHGGDRDQRAGGDRGQHASRVSTRPARRGSGGSSSSTRWTPRTSTSRR